MKPIVHHKYISHKDINFLSQFEKGTIHPSIKDKVLDNMELPVYFKDGHDRRFVRVVPLSLNKDIFNMHWGYFFTFKRHRETEISYQWTKRHVPIYEVSEIIEGLLAVLDRRYNLKVNKDNVFNYDKKDDYLLLNNVEIYKKGKWDFNSYKKARV